MRSIRRHIQTITETYDGNVPLAHFLKNYFRQNPVLGSRDRKILSAIAYTYYRCAKGFNGNEWFHALTDKWLDNPKQFADIPLTKWLNENERFPFDLAKLFPNDIPLSEGIDKAEWLRSMLVQPALFIRIRKDRKKLLSMLTDSQIPATPITEYCMSLPNGAKIDALLPPDSYVVQDASSQQTGKYFNPKKGESWYDCCAGAGGKSLLLKDMEAGVSLTVSDRRESILHNLKERFRLYGHKLPTACVTDVADPKQLLAALGSTKFDNIICDAPCSGSGTWARTPEQMYFFNPGTLQAFSSLQKDIATNVAAYLRPGGRLIYITCSVFRAENEEVAEQVARQTGMTLIFSQLINGMSIHADSMYVAVLENNEKPH